MRNKIQAALDEGYSPDEVLDFLAAERGFSAQVTAARNEGYDDGEILDFLATSPSAGKPKGSWSDSFAAAGTAAEVSPEGARDILDAVGEWGRELFKKKPDSVMEGVEVERKPLIQARGAPLTKEAYGQIQGAWENADEEGRADLEGRNGYVGSAARTVADAYDRAPTNDATDLVDGRIERKEARYRAQGADVQTARAMAVTNAAGGSVKESPYTFADQVSDSMAQAADDSEVVRNATRAAMDLFGSAAKVAPTTAKMATDTLQLIPFISDIAKDGSDALADMIEAIGRRQSGKLQGQALRMSEVVRSGSVGDMAALLTNNPSLLMDVAIPSAASVLLIAGAGNVAGVVAGMKHVDRVPLSVLADIQQKARMSGVLYGNMAVNAGAAFDETDGPAAAKYAAALIAGAGTRLMHGVADGGAEGALINAGRRAAGSNPVATAAGVIGREMLQEFGEGSSQALGSQIGEVLSGARDSLSLTEIRNQGMLESVAAGPVGAGAGIRAAVAEQYAPDSPVQASPYEQGIDAIARQVSSPDNARMTLRMQADEAQSRIAGAGSVDDAINAFADAANATSQDLLAGNNAASAESMRQAAARVQADAAVAGGDVLTDAQMDEQILAMERGAAESDPELAALEEEARALDVPALAQGIEIQQRETGTLELRGDKVKELLQAIVPDAPAVTRADGSALVSARFAGPVIEAVAAAKTSPSYSQLRRMSGLTETATNVPPTQQVAPQAQEASGQEGEAAVTAPVGETEPAPFFVLAPGTGMDDRVELPVWSESEAQQKVREYIKRTGMTADQFGAGVQLFDANTGQPAARINFDGDVVKTETREEARARSESAARGQEGEARSSIGREPASWVIRSKETGEAVMETFDRAKVDALNTKKYEAVPILQHLQELNRGIKSAQAPAAPIQTAPTQPPADAWVSVSAPVAPQMSASGNPFKTERAAAASAKQRKLDMVPVEVDGGWGLTQKAAEPLTLDTYTNDEILQREETQRAAEEREAKRRQEEDRRAQADAELDNFTLTGSNRPADLLAAQGQVDMFGNSPTPEFDDDAPSASDGGPQLKFSRAGRRTASRSLDVFVPDAYDAQQFAQAVDRIAAAETAPRTDLTVGDTPAVLRALGAKALPVQMPSSMIHKARRPEVRNHDVPAEVLRQLPALLADPVMVFDSQTEQGALVALVDARDGSGRPVVVAVHLEARGSGFHSINRIASIYGKDRASDIERWMRGSLRYYQTRKAPQWLRAVGLQLPEANTIKRLNPRVITESGVVNAAGARFSFAGRRAQTADRLALDTAQQRINAGEDAETVRRETGWHVGADGKWRFEISDADARLTDEAWARVTDESGSNLIRLGDALEHPALFAAYPAVADYAVLFVDGQLGAADGSFSDGVITLERGQSNIVSTLLHEIQHGIQSVEGFASGGNPRGAYNAPNFDLYRRLAGEVEARNTQTRQRMTDAERRATPPGQTADVPDPDVIVTFNGKDMASAPTPANAALLDRDGARGKSRPATMTRDDIRQAAIDALPGMGRVVDEVLRRGEEGKAGGVVVVEDAGQLAETFADKTGRDMDDAVRLLGSDAEGNAQGFYDPQSGLTFLVAPNLTAQTAPAVLLHEATHARQRASIDQRALALIEGRAKAVKPVRTFLDGVAARMEEAGETGNAEEATAYIVEEAVLQGRQAGFSAADGKLMSWIDRKLGKRVGDIVRDFVAMVRAWAMRAGMTINLSVDDLVALAKLNVRDMGRGDVGGQSGFSRASQIASAAFKRWFGDSKVVDAEGKPLVVYHGTGSDVTQFNRMSWGSTDPSLAGEYAEMRGEWYDGQANVMPVYMNIRRPFDADTLDTPASFEYPDGLSVTRFIDQIIEQSGVSESEQSELRALEQRIRAAARQEESGPSYSPENFWYRPAMLFGEDGASQIRRVFEIAGFDGVRLTEQGAVTYGAFRPEQIKSAIGNNGNFDPANPDIRFSKSGRSAPAAVYSSPKMPEGFVAKKIDWVTYQFQDKYKDLKAIQQSISDAGHVIRDQFNPYQAETLMHGKSAYRVSQFLEGEIDPVLTLMRKAQISIDDLNEYIHARHAKERNAEMAKRNPNEDELDALIDEAAAELEQAEQAADAAPDDGALAAEVTRAASRLRALQNTAPWSGTEEDRQRLSGLSNEAADKVLAKAHGGMKATAYRKLGDMVDALIMQTRAEQVAYGLESPEAMAAMASAYQHYVPLKRDIDESELLGSTSGTGAGLSIRGSMIKQATGSLRDVENILANIVMAREATIVRGEKNRVAKAMYGMMLENPNSELYSVIRPNTSAKALRRQLANMGLDEDTIDNMVSAPSKPVIDPKTGLVKRQVNPYSTLDNAIVLRVAGEDRVILFNRQSDTAVRLVKALRNDDTDFSSGAAKGLMQTLGPVTRYISAINTQYNLVFGLKNFTRDVQEAMLNMSATEMAGSQKAFMKNVPLALAAIRSDVRGDGSNKHRDLYHQFLADGGATGYRDLYANLENRVKAIQRDLEGSGIRNAKGIKQTLDFISDYNTVIENGVRFAAYKTAIEAGLSRARAAELAKDLTVNFNRKGARTGFFSSLYAFFNPVVQGANRMARTLKSPAGKKIIAGGVALGALQAVLGILALGDDWDEIPEFERAQNLIIPTFGLLGSKKYLKIPMALGFSAIPNIGRSLVEMAYFRDRLGDRSLGLVLSVLNSVNPLGSDSLVDMWAPSAAKPLIQAGMNRNAFDRAIEQREFSDLAPTPGWSRGKEDTSAIFKGLAYAINWVTSGGDEYEKGLVSPTPEMLSFITGNITGGVGRELTKAVTFAERLVLGEDIPSYSVPVLGMFYGHAAGESMLRAKYYAALKEINVAEFAAKRRIEAGEDLGKYAGRAGLASAGRLIQNAISVLRKINQDTSDHKKREELNAVILDLQSRLVEMYDENEKREP